MYRYSPLCSEYSNETNIQHYTTGTLQQHLNRIHRIAWKLFKKKKTKETKRGQTKNNTDDALIYEGVSKSPRTMLITRKSLVVHEFPARVCCGGVL